MALMVMSWTGCICHARHALEAASDEEELHQFARVERVGVGRHHAENRLHEAAHGLHSFAEFVVGFGVDAGVAGDLAVSLPWSFTRHR